MLKEWKKVKNNPPRKVLNQAIEDCCQGNKDILTLNIDIYAYCTYTANVVNMYRVILVE